MKHWRIYFLMTIVFLLSGGVLARLFILQIIQYDYYAALAQGQHQLYETLFPERGEIFMQDLASKQRDGKDHYCPLAINKKFQRVYLVPNDVPDEEKENLSNKLVEILDLDKEIVSQRINKLNDPYEPLKSKVDEEAVEKIRGLNIPGIGLTLEDWRYYPNKTLASHLSGFVGIIDEDKVGQYGLEGYYENDLNGNFGFLSGEKDISGYWIPSVNRKVESAQDGVDIILTIDENIQFRAEKELKEIVEKWDAEKGTIIIMEPKTGAILAMANWPVFDPNEYNKVENINVFLNPSIQEIFEPGSVFKPITMAIGLDSDKINSDTIYVDEGQVRIKGSVINNVDGKAYGEQNMVQVLEKSLNTGAVFVQQSIGEDIFQEYIQRFNFDRPTGIDLVGEIGGDISNLFTGREINLATISFGQGITMTPLSLITAISAIANDGKLMRPFIVEKIISLNGEEKIIKPELINRVISSETAEEVTRMLVSVVENGYGKPAQLSGYDIAGKTGTAQMADLEKGGYSEETIHSFVGYAPAFNPEFAILIKLDKPQGIRFASDSVSPVFKKLAEYLLSYLEIPPQ